MTRSSLLWRPPTPARRPREPSLLTGATLDSGARRVATSAHPDGCDENLAPRVQGEMTVNHRDSKLSILLTSVLCLGLSSQLGACGSSEGTSGDGDSTTETSTGTGTSSEGTTTADTSSTTGTTTTGDGDGDADSSGFVPTDTGTDTTTGTTGAPGPNGSMCGSDAECESEICVDVAGFTGLCSECRTDQDCMDAGTGLNCSIGQAGYFECGSGAQGTMCMSDDACDGDLVCAQVVDLGGLFNDQFCSECKDDSGCAAGEQCVPQYDLASFSGERGCAPEGSLAQDALCDDDTQCMSGICGTADVMGFLQLGVCSECDTDADCGGGTCTPASADVLGGGGLAGGTCSP